MAVKNESAFQKYPGQIVLGVVFVLCLVLSLINVGLEGDTQAELEATNALAGKLSKKVASEKILITPPLRLAFPAQIARQPRLSPYAGPAPRGVFALRRSRPNGEQRVSKTIQVL